MAKQLKEIEIPLGAKDSELCGWEYTIPEGMEATIVDNKIIVKKKESENERIRKELYAVVNDLVLPDEQKARFNAWLEKQGEQKAIIVPKFRVGDTVRAKTMKNFVFTIKDITDKQYVDTNDGKYDIEGQDHLELVEQKPVDWSEEDETKLNDVIRLVENSGHVESIREHYVDWLKSLRPQNRWKPSELQIQALESATENCAYSEYQDCLRELIEQLKKLKE